MPEYLEEYVLNVGNDYRTASYWYRTSTYKARILTANTVPKYI